MAGALVIARTSSSPAMLTGSEQAVVDAAGHRRDGQPGPALLGGGQQGGLVDHTDRAGRCRSR